MAGFLIAFLLGLAVGSFLNLCIYRLPADEALVGQPARCPACGARLGWADLIPIVSYFRLHGRCPVCGAPFVGRRVAVELATGALFAWCFATFGPGAIFVKAIILTSFLVVITVIDYDHHLILDRVVVALAATGIAVNLVLYLDVDPGPFAAQIVSPPGMLYGGLLGGIVMLVVALLPGSGMGGGDIKFAAALGLWFGWQLTIPLLVLAFIFGGAGAALLLLLKRKGKKDYMPYGPYIAAGALATMLYGPKIVAWYLLGR
jgi:leader peptidase (prepilin peptidase)/N-methyltransferase